MIVCANIHAQLAVTTLFEKVKRTGRETGHQSSHALLLQRKHRVTPTSISTADPTYTLPNIKSRGSYLKQNEEQARKRDQLGPDRS